MDQLNLSKLVHYFLAVDICCKYILQKNYIRNIFYPISRKKINLLHILIELNK